MDKNDVLEFGKHVKKIIRTQHPGLTLNEYFSRGYKIYNVGMHIILKKTRTVDIKSCLHFSIMKDESACDMKVDVFRSNQKDIIIPTPEIQFEKIWDEFKEVLYSVYMIMLKEFEKFVKKYPVFRMNYLMNPGGLLLTKPQKIEDFKNHINV